MNKIMTANFQGTDFLGVELDGMVFVVLKPLVEAMGLAWNGQLERIKRNAVLLEGMRMERIPSPRGGNQETAVLRLDRLHGWLFTVDSGHVREEIRDRVQMFQRECHQVLSAHFCGDRDKVMREAYDAESMSLRLVTEARHIWGDHVAAQLWDKRGLTKVPAMDDAVWQRSLFDWNDQRKAA